MAIIVLFKLVWSIVVSNYSSNIPFNQKKKKNYSSQSLKSKTNLNNLLLFQVTPNINVSLIVLEGQQLLFKIQIGSNEVRIFLLLELIQKLKRGAYSKPMTRNRETYER